MSKEDQRAAGDTDLLEEEKKDEGDPLSLDNIDDDDDDDDDGRGGDIDNKVEATDEYSNGERSAYPHGGDKQGADGTAEKCEMNSSPGDSETTITEKNDRPSGLNEALLVEVASFVPRGLTLCNICVALGFKSATVRKIYLEGNYRFLEEVMQGYRTAEWRQWGKQKCAADALAWMDVNRDWQQNYVLWPYRELNDRVTPRDTIAFMDVFNPKRAIELDLLDDVLEFFIEDLSDFMDLVGHLSHVLGRWHEELRRLLDIGDLLDHSLACDNFEAFEYLLSWTKIDLDTATFLFAWFVDWCINHNSKHYVVVNSKKYFEAIVTHPQFSPNAEFAMPSGMRFTPLSLIIFSILDDFTRGCFRGGLLKKLEILLEAGADPNLPTEVFGTGIILSPLQMVRRFRDQPIFSMWRSQWQAVVDVFTDHNLVRSMAELSLH